ncbi:hypothetical protein ACFYSF_45770 [Streptomyces canus]|uniref:hypothetical protein n=1 Tax=Streptomyces canus TaxID=58343 RepID=UPI00368F327F
MRSLIDRLGLPAVVIGVCIIIALGFIGYEAEGADSGGGLDNTSAEYQDGWNQAVSFGLPTRYGMSEGVEKCTLAVDNKTDPGAGQAGYSFFPHWDTYNGHQRKEWAHGCLDALRNLTNYKVAKQSWE